MNLTDQCRLEKLVDFVRYYANCPCCDNDEKCDDDCTFEDDDAMGYGVMVHAREALCQDGRLNHG